MSRCSQAFAWGGRRRCPTLLFCLFCRPASSQSLLSSQPHLLLFTLDRFRESSLIEHLPTRVVADFEVDCQARLPVSLREILLVDCLGHQRFDGDVASTSANWRAMRHSTEKALSSTSTALLTFTIIDQAAFKSEIGCSRQWRVLVLLCRRSRTMQGSLRKVLAWTFSTETGSSRKLAKERESSHGRAVALCSLGSCPRSCLGM